MIWQIPRIWENKEVWIIGGGYSVFEQFGVPSSIQKKILSKELPYSTLEPYLERLNAKPVIGVNMAFLLGDCIDLCFFGDKNFPQKVADAGYSKEFAEFFGWKVTCHHSFTSDPLIKYVAHSKSFRFGISDNPNVVCWNHNSGGAAISIAANAGASRIVLVGFDMKDVKKRTHWHDGYGKAFPPFDKHLIGFDQIAKDADKRKIEIINANPDSAITQFQKCTVKELLGDYESQEPTDLKIREI